MGSTWIPFMVAIIIIVIALNVGNPRKLNEDREANQMADIDETDDFDDADFDFGDDDDDEFDFGDDDDFDFGDDDE